MLATVGQLSDETRAVTYGVIKLGEPVENGIPTLRSSNVRHLYLDLNGLKRISPAIAKNYRRTLLKGGEVLVTVRGTLGGVIVAPSTCAGYNISREVARIALVDDSLGAIVALFIASPSIQRWLHINTKGIAYTGINIETLRKMPIPLPPRSEQHRIVEEIEKQFTRLDAAMAALGGDVLRRSVDEVEAEVAAIEEAERKAAFEAERELVRSRRDRDRDAAHAKVEALKAKLGRHDGTSAKGEPTDA